MLKSFITEVTEAEQPRRQSAPGLLQNDGYSNCALYSLQ